ncbi:GNAT family N-acetyltransferase [Anaerosolibacter sp.]|uniref:GNAT family N-acetyltransferase n=1 Tax=Anaerosolibacter sp. TaxID=1872527 RepID=UPI0039EEA79D
MLTIKNAMKEDILHIENLGDCSPLHGIELQDILENTMVAYEGNIPLAAAGYESFGSVAVLRFVIVHKEHQREYLGDGIVKALLNLADKRGIELMLVDTQHCTEFFAKVGFQDLDEDQKSDVNISQIINNNLNAYHKLFAAKLPDFFLKACRSNK